MEQMFTKAAKLLPPNIQKIYGGDGGQWVGLKTEAVDAMDALSAELTFLEGERKKSGKNIQHSSLNVLVHWRDISRFGDRGYPLAQYDC